MIAGRFDEDGLANLVLSHRLIWMPAHQTQASIRSVTRSDGRLLSCIDYRANRLVDALAKGAAAAQRSRPDIRNLVRSAGQAAQHAVALLGVVTRAANEHRTEVTDANGVTTTAVRRDALTPCFPRSMLKRTSAALTCLPPPVPLVAPGSLNHDLCGGGSDLHYPLLDPPSKRPRVEAACMSRSGVSRAAEIRSRASAQLHSRAQQRAASVATDDIVRRRGAAAARPPPVLASVRASQLLERVRARLVAREPG